MCAVVSFSSPLKIGGVFLCSFETLAPGGKKCSIVRPKSAIKSIAASLTQEKRKRGIRPSVKKEEDLVEGYVTRIEGLRRSRKFERVRTEFCREF